MTDKPFKTIEQQFDILHDDRNLKVLNPEAAKILLTRYGYYEIINGYKEPFLNNSKNDDDGFKPDANFEHIYQLFALDKHIREITLQGIEEFESNFKQAVAYSISDCISDNQRRYTAPSHYNRGKTYTDRNGQPVRRHPFNDRDRMLFNFGKIISSQRQPFSYYHTHHGNVPPWILVKDLTLGQVIYWFRLSKPEVRLEVIGRMIAMDPAVIKSLDDSMKIKQAFGDLLDLVLNYRNLTAHGGRVYNHRSKLHKLRDSPFLLRRNVLNTSKTKYKTGYRQSSLGALILALGIIENPDPRITIATWLETYVSDYLSNYPQDEQLLVESLEIEDTTMLSVIHAAMTTSNPK